VDYRLNVKDLSNPKDLARLITSISEIADECDTLYTETAPNGNISARQGRVALYNNSGTYTLWINTDGGTIWTELTSQSLWQVDGTETQLKTADEIDMQSKKIINLLDPTADQDAASKKYVDDTAGGKVSDVAYAASWDNVTTIAPSKNAVYDKINSLADINTSNVVLQWLGSKDANDGWDYGIATALISGAFAPVDHLLSQYWADGATRESILLRTKFIKVAGILTVTIYAYSNGSWTNAGSEPQIKISIGTQTLTLTQANKQTWEWLSGTIDVSSLTNGTAYDVTVGFIRTGTSNPAYINMASIVGFGS